MNTTPAQSILPEDGYDFRRRAQAIAPTLVIEPDNEYSRGWRSEAAVKLPCVQAFAAALAAALGWSVKPPKADTEPNEHWSNQLVGPDGEEIGLSFDWHKFRYTVSGTYPSDQRSNDYVPHDEKGNQPRPGYAFKRTPEDVANDLQRRFFPEYRRIRGLALARMNMYQEHHNKVNAQRAELVAVLGTHGKLGVDCNRRDDERTVEVPYHSTGCYGKFKVSEDRADVELTNLTMNEAKTLAALLVQWRTRRSGN